MEKTSRSEIEISQTPTHTQIAIYAAVLFRIEFVEGEGIQAYIYMRERESLNLDFRFGASIAAALHEGGFD